MTSNSQAPIAVVTGATSGIGFETALALAEQGFRLIALGRDAERIAAKRAEIDAAAPGATIAWVRADFASMAEVEQAAIQIAALTDRIDVLVNNAGAHLDRRIETVDGLEATFATNHLSSFSLTLRLLPLLKRSERGHVIAVSSIGHTMIEDMCWDDLQLERDFDPLKAYCQSKLANVLFTRELARRLTLSGSNIIASAVHPGLVASRFALSAPPQTLAFYQAAEARGEALTEKEGADTVIWLALNPDAALPSGGYFALRERLDPSAAAQDLEGGLRLWEISERLAGIAA